LTVALVWTQFSAYHIDRIEAAAKALGGNRRLIACEIATASAEYAWAPSGDTLGAEKITLFPGRAYETVPWPRRLCALARGLKSARTVFLGVSYGEPEILPLAWWLRLTGRRVVMMSDSKFDDRPRGVARELLKALALSVFNAALVAGPRQVDYVRFLGFRRRPVRTGYDRVSLTRVRALAAWPPAPEGPPFADRPFIFVGRFVAKKNLLLLARAYGRYVELSGRAARRLVIAGGGELEAELRRLIDQLGISQLVEFPGFLQAEGVARALSSGLALILPSVEEQWGLVVNEALAFNLPIIASLNVGARDTLAKSLVNAVIVEPDNIEGFARAMLMVASEEEWRRLVAGSAVLAPLADVGGFAEAVAELA